MQSLQMRLFADRFLPFDRDAAIAFALLGSRAAAKGYSIFNARVPDCRHRRGAWVCGGYTRYCAFLAVGVPVINPWES